MANRSAPALYPVAILCEEGGGHRFNKTALQYQLYRKNLEEIMSLTIEQATDFFQSPKISARLQPLYDVGLSYMTLGQPTITLSRGKVQRLKTASKLHQKGNIYVMDERFTGLHGNDVNSLLELLRRPIFQSYTVVIVEHGIELVAAADWAIQDGEELLKLETITAFRFFENLIKHTKRRFQYGIRSTEQ